MRREKHALFAALRQRYDKLKEEWEGYSGYDKWFDKPINNARLTSIAVYRDRVPDFLRWLKACDDNLPLFYQRMDTLSKLEKPVRHQRLRAEANCSS